MKIWAAFGVLLLAGCTSETGKKQEPKAPAWRDGESVSEDGTRFQILCLNGEWRITLKTIERLVPPEADRQWVNRDVTFQFDSGAVQRTKGTLNENRLDLTQAQEGSTVDLNYGQDVAAGLIRGSYKALTIRTTDGSNRPKEWRFDVEGSRGHIPNYPSEPCPMASTSDRS